MHLFKTFRQAAKGRTTLAGLILIQHRMGSLSEVSIKSSGSILEPYEWLLILLTLLVVLWQMWGRRWFDPIVL